MARPIRRIGGRGGAGLPARDGSRRGVGSGCRGRGAGAVGAGQQPAWQLQHPTPSARGRAIDRGWPLPLDTTPDVHGRVAGGAVLRLGGALGTGVVWAGGPGSGVAGEGRPGGTLDEGGASGLRRVPVPHAAIHSRCVLSAPRPAEACRPRGDQGKWQSHILEMADGTAPLTETARTARRLLETIDRSPLPARARLCREPR